MIRLRGEFIEMDPTQWSEEMDVEVNAGVGVGRNQLRGQVLTQVGMVMEKLKGAGFRGIGEEQIYNWFVDVLKAADMPAIDPYCQDVTKMDPPQPPPPPDPTKDIVYVVEEMKEKYRLAIEQMKNDTKRDKDAQDLAIEAQKMGSAEAIETAKVLQDANDGESEPTPVPPAGNPPPVAAGAPLSDGPPPVETFFGGNA